MRGILLKVKVLKMLIWWELLKVSDIHFNQTTCSFMHSLILSTGCIDMIKSARDRVFEHTSRLMFYRTIHASFSAEIYFQTNNFCKVLSIFLSHICLLHRDCTIYCYMSHRRICWASQYTHGFFLLLKWQNLNVL